jgi:hypothetical protein
MTKALFAVAVVVISGRRVTGDVEAAGYMATVSFDIGSVRE